MDSLKASCSECQKILVAKAIPHHLQLTHQKSLIAYGCAENSYFRSFNTITSLRNHDIRCHRKLNSPISLPSYNREDLALEQINHLKTQPLELPIHPITCTEINRNELLQKPEIETNRSSFSENALGIAANLYGDLNLNRNQATNIINVISSSILNSDEMNSLKESVIKLVHPSLANDIYKQFNNLQSSFADISSEHMLIKTLRERNYFIDPIPVIYGYRQELRNKVLESVKCEGFAIPLAKHLKNYFEMKNVLSKTLNYMKTLESKEKIENIIQTNFWKSKISNVISLTLPLFIYEDAFEPGNSLGSHAGIQSMSAMYCSIPCLPPEFRSQLNNIFLVQIAYASDIKTFGSKVAYDNVIKQLNTLSSDGIDINIGGTKIKLYFKLALIIGDNLGLNSMLGFTSSFNSNYFCRFCKISKKMSCYESNVKNCLLRNKINYNSDILKNNVQDSGIKEQCAWNDVDGFHVTENFCVDIMHDVFEGVCNYDMGSILYELISVKKLFTLEDLNFKITNFNYPDNVNRPPTISPSELSNKLLKMSAAEMKNFILHAALIIADLLPRKDMLHWKLYLLLRQIVCVILKPEICDDDIQLLDELVKKHHIYM